MTSIEIEFRDARPVRVKNLVEELGGDDAPLVVDVRPPDMYEDMHIGGAVNIHQDELGERAAYAGNPLGRHGRAHA